MLDDLPLPALTNPLWVLGFFALFLLVLHFALVGRLTRSGWRRVDYIWLGVAALGLLGASAEARRLVARGLVNSEAVYLDATWNRLRDTAAFLEGGAVCRVFMRTAYSPPDFDTIQQEYDRACEYGKQLLASLPKERPDTLQELQTPQRPLLTAPDLLSFYELLDMSWSEYTQARSRFERIQAATGQSSSEAVAIVFSPLLLALALALRITKVAGERRLGF